MLLLLHIFVYCVFVAAVLIYMLAGSASGRRKQYRRPMIIGLVASPLGLVAPYLFFILAALFCNEPWSYDGIPVVGPYLRAFFPALLWFGPCVGPPMVFFLALRFTKRPDAM